MEFIRKNVNNRTNTVTSSSGGGSYSGSSGFSGTLETHTIFSQPFNGTYDVRGDLADVDNITANGSVTTDSGFIVKGKDTEGIYTDEDLNIYIEDGASEFKGMQGYNFDNNVSAPLFVGNVSATEGTITDLISNNITTSKCIVNNADNNGTKLSIYFNKDGTQFEGGKVYNFDSSIITSSVEAENVNSENLATNVGTISELSSTNILVEEYLSSAYADISEALSTYEFTAFDADISKIISSTIEVDNLTVKKAAHFFKLIIDEIKSVGGQLIISPANASFDKVVISDGNYKCYFRAVEGDRKIDNQFEVNDQVVCQTFNASEGINFDASNKFYWRLVIAKGTEKLSGIDYHYIILSDSDKDSDSNGVPTEGDKVALLGNRSDTSRQNAIIISAYSSAFLDSGITAPFIVQYSGVNNYNLYTHRNSIISNGKNLFTGDFVLTSGESVEGQIAQIKETANDISMFVQEPDQVNMFEGSNGYNYGCWKVTGVSVNTKSGTDYILVLGGSNNGGYILQPSKYFVTTNKVNVSLDVSELQGLSSYYSMEICDKDGKVISNKFNLSSGKVTYAFTLTKVPNSIIYLKISLIAGSRLAFKNEKALMESVPKRISGIEVDIDSITSRVSNAEGNITNVIQKADGLSTKVSTLEGDISEIEQTVGKITTRIANVEGDVSEIIQNASELSSKVTNLEGDISEVSQKTDGIATRVSTAEGNISQIIQNANTISSRIDSVEGDISEISQKADLIESKIVTEDTINSKISQSKSSIKAEVYDEMNQATGINVTNGNITLNADKTTIKGNLNITDTNYGITIYETTKDQNQNTLVPRINIQPKRIQDITDINNDTYEQFACTYSAANNTWSVDLGYKELTCAKNDTLHIDKLSITEMRMNDSGQIVYPSSASCKLVVKLIKGTDAVLDSQEYTLNRINSYGAYEGLGQVRFSIPSNGIYRVLFTSIFSITASSSYPQMVAYANARIQQTKNAITYIGTDGMYSHSGANKFFCVNEKETIIQHGFNGIKWDNSDKFYNKAMMVAAGLAGTAPNYKPVWYPFYNFTCMFAPSSYTYTKIVNDGNSYSKYSYKINPLKDNGICYLQRAATDASGNNQETWILLPPSVFYDENGTSYQLPVGYTVQVINGGFDDNKFNAYVSADVDKSHKAVFVDGHRDKNWKITLNGDVHWDRFVYVGSYYSSDCNDNQDIWMTLQDAQ